jgi:hypothetical protein
VIYGYISVSAYTSLTTVTVVMDSTPLDNGLSIVNVAFLTGTNQSVPANVQLAVLATTATTANRTDSGEVTVTAHATNGDIFSAAANSIIWDDVGGAITATAFPAASKAGMTRDLRLNGASKFTAGANFLIEGIISGNTITLGDGAECHIRAITTTQFKMTYNYSGTFTITGTGFVSNPTGTAYWRLNNGVVTLRIPSLSGVSNNAAFTLTGLPAAIIPAASFNLVGGTGYDVTTGQFIVFMQTAGSSGTLYLSKVVPGGAWVNANTKTFDNNVITYPIN